MINECSNSWLEMVPTIEGGNPRGAAKPRRGEPRRVSASTFSYGRTKLSSLYCSRVIGLVSFVSVLTHRQLDRLSSAFQS